MMTGAALLPLMHSSLWEPSSCSEQSRSFFPVPPQPKLDDQHKDPRKSYALIVGTVWGPDDRPVHGVKVKIRRADQKQGEMGAILQSHWRVRSSGLPAGKGTTLYGLD